LFFSIIIPVFNVERYLPECIESILPQLENDAELILVNDGSTDSSGEICERYRSERVKVIHCPNQGASLARNTGMRQADGEYILFIDSDDFIEPFTLSRLRLIIQDSTPDVIVGQAYYYYPSGSRAPILPPYDESCIVGKEGIQVLSYFCQNFLSTFWAAYLIVCRLDLIRQFNLRFPEKVIMMEDLDWAFRLFPKAKNIAMLNQPFYNYRQQRSGSVTMTANLKQLDDCFSICAGLAAFYEKMAVAEEQKRIIIGKLGHLIASHAQKIPLLPPAEQAEAYLKLEKLKPIVWGSRDKRCRFFARLWRIFGLKNAVRVLDLRRRVKEKIAQWKKL